MAQGDRFRRKALRRGYKVDEVDDFLERAEATLAGEPVNPPMSAGDIRDVVFRTRFGGYDEWQVDLHLDRLERELEDYATGAAPRGSNGFPAREDSGVTTQIPRIRTCNPSRWRRPCRWRRRRWPRRRCPYRP